MAYRTRRRGQVFPKVAAAFGVLVFLAGSVLAFMVPQPQVNAEKTEDPEPKATLALPQVDPLPSFKPKESPSPTAPKKPAPSAKKSSPSTASASTPTPAPSKPSTSTKPTRKPSPAAPTVKPVPKPTPSSTPKPTPTKTTRPTPTPTSTPAPPANTTLRAQVIALINQQRAQVGVSALASNSHLSDQCQQWSTSMASRKVLQHSNMNYGGEIIASGPTTAAAVVDLWMNSPPHREIMLSSRYTLVGSGYVNGYWTVQFG